MRGDLCYLELNLGETKGMRPVQFEIIDLAQEDRFPVVNDVIWNIDPSHLKERLGQIRAQ